MGDAEDLNYHLNYNMFLCKSVLSSLESPADRQKVIRWMRKLASCNQSIDEMKLRNDFMYYLVINVQKGELKPPFDDNPPLCPLTSIAYTLPVDLNVPDPSPSEAAAELTSPKSKYKKPFVYSQSTDGGSFLLAPPLPSCGAFCYLAVVSKSPRTD